MIDPNSFPHRLDFSFYNPSPAYYFFSRKSSLRRSPVNVSSISMPKQFFMRPFLPLSLAKHIKAKLRWRHRSVKLNEAAILEESEAKGGVTAGLDKNFGFSSSSETSINLNKIHCFSICKNYLHCP
ncbi:hypothetical protein TorRG33x02_160030 [Trema orientale]|uniref:Uncharacterized protein n=1 Tax=Trema orientale TaxID=63057 RepID=A0A2P5ERK4_TREOI|nr:hypothetical protein TorRG33x02_160030 [Trema orientale]